MPHFRDFDGYSTMDCVLDRALKNDRCAAEYIWRDIAKGETAFVEDIRWVRHVADRIVRTLIDGDPESKGRAQLALQALGLAGARNRDEKLYREYRASQVFGDDDDGHGESKPATRTEIAKGFIKAGLLPKNSNIRAAAKQLDRIAAKFERKDE